MTVVELAPEFIKKMADAKVTAGEAAAFEIELSKGDAMTKWYKNGAEIDLASDKRRVGLKIDGKKQILEISAAETADAGEYSCTIANAAKCSANLVVEEPKVNFVERLTETSVGEVGKDVQLKVNLSKADVAVSWFKGSSTVEKSDKYEISSEGTVHTLVIKNATEEDIAEYACAAENVSEIKQHEFNKKIQCSLCVTAWSKQNVMRAERCIPSCAGEDDHRAGAEGRLHPGDRGGEHPPGGGGDQGAGRHAHRAAGQGRAAEAAGAVVLPGQGHQGERKGERESNTQ